MITMQEARNLIGASAYDQDGQKVGDVATLYLDQATGEPEWVTVKTGLFGRTWLRSRLPLLMPVWRWMLRRPLASTARLLPQAWKPARIPPRLLACPTACFKT